MSEIQRKRSYLRLIHIKQRELQNHELVWVLKLEYFDKVFEIILDEWLGGDKKAYVSLQQENLKGEIPVQVCNDLRSKFDLSYLRIKEIISDMKHWDDDDGKYFPVEKTSTSL